MATPQGRAQTALIGPDNRAATRIPLGYWPAEADQFREEPWHAPLYSAFKSSMAALQRHEAADTAALLAKANNAPPVPKDEREKFEYRHLDREMTTLEAAAERAGAIAGELERKRNSLSPFKVAIDRQDVDGATQRAEQRALLRALAPADRLKALRGDLPEFTATAILSAPPSSSALSDEQWGNFRESRLRALHGAKMQSLDAAAAAAKLVRRTLDAARASTRVRITPFLPNVEIEPKTVAAPWVS